MIAPLPLDEINRIVAEYRYDGKLVPKVWAAEFKAPFDNRTSEMVVACKAFGRLAHQDVVMSKETPFPDLFLDCEVALPVARNRYEWDVEIGPFDCIMVSNLFALTLFRRPPLPDT